MDKTPPTADVDKQSVTIDVAMPENAEVLAEILSHAIQNKVAHGDMVWGTVPYMAEDMHERIEKGNTYIARVGNIPVGAFSLVWDDEIIWGKQRPNGGYVHQLAVKDGYRGLGLGEQLLDWAGQQTAKNGREFLRIDIPPENKGLKAYYEKLGFKWVQDREVHAPHVTYTAALYERPAQG